MGLNVSNNRRPKSLHSPDELEARIRVTNAGVWLTLLVTIALLCALFAWGAFGKVSTTVQSNGVYANNAVLCFLDSGIVSKVSPGDVATIDGHRTTVKEIAQAPIARNDISAMLGSDYLAATLASSEWSYPVTFNNIDGVELAPETPLKVIIVTEQVSPLSLILKSANN